MGVIKIESRKTISDHTYRLEEIVFTKSGLDHKIHEQKNEVYFRPDGVAVLLVDVIKEEFILIKQVRLPVFLNPQGTNGGYLIEACAGLIEPGEDPLQAVIREAEEETGFRISAPLKVGEVYTSAGGLTEFLHLFVSVVDSSDKVGDGGGAKGEGEDIQVVRLKFAEAKNGLASGKINDSKTMLLLQHYFLYH